MSQEIKFVVSPDGSEVEAEALGFKGKACEETLQPLLARIGGSPTDKKKPEYNLTNPAGVRINR